MKHKLTVLFAMLATLLLIVACGPKEAAKETPVGETETAADKDIGGVESDISDIDAMTEESDMSDLDSLDNDLSDLESLDI